MMTLKLFQTIIQTRLGGVDPPTDANTPSLPFMQTSVKSLQMMCSSTNAQLVSCTKNVFDAYC